MITRYVVLGISLSLAIEPLAGTLACGADG
jgi:hypothetical protein